MTFEDVECFLAHFHVRCVRFNYSAFHHAAIFGYDETSRPYKFRCCPRKAEYVPGSYDYGYLHAT